MDEIDNSVYLGLWTNWSRGKVAGLTLTTTQRQGGLLIAFTATFISFVTARFWSICRLIFHICYYTSDPRHTIHHQRQIILRNSSSPAAALLQLFSLIWAWRGLGIKGLVGVFPLAFVAATLFAAFTAAGGFSSIISTATGNEALIKGDHCGILGLGNGTTFNISPLSYFDKQLNDAANYAQQCYSNTSVGLLDCNKFVIESLPTAVANYTASCPFDPDICRSNQTNLVMDTGYLDSNNAFGLNSPGDERLSWRYRLQCAPLVTDGYTAKVVQGNKTWTTYNYGKLIQRSSNGTMPNYTYMFEDVDYQYTHQAPGGKHGTSNFVLNSASVGISGGTYMNSSDFIPNSKIYRHDGDVTLVFLSGNGVLFSEPMGDDWYRATMPAGEVSNAAGTAQLETYRPEEAASPLGCFEQWQWCNTEYPNNSGCGPLASAMDAYQGAAPFFNLTPDDLATDRPSSATELGSRLLWPLLIQMDGFGGLTQTLLQLGAKSLSSQSQLYAGIQWPLPRNQWQLDVINWWNVNLASIQASFVYTALGTTDPELQNFLITPTNDKEGNLCRNQKIRSSAYTSVSVLGLCLIYGIGALIVVTSFLTEPALRRICERRKNRNYQHLEWASNSALQLHRRAQQELGVEWSGCRDTVPVTKGEVMLVNSDVRDARCSFANEGAGDDTAATAPTVVPKVEQPAQATPEAGKTAQNTKHDSVNITENEVTTAATA